MAVLGTMKSIAGYLSPEGTTVAPKGRQFCVLYTVCAWKRCLYR